MRVMKYWVIFLNEIWVVTLWSKQLNLFCFGDMKFVFRNIVDSSALRDIKESSAYENYQLPKLYIKQYYCIEAAVHQRIVRVRSALDRKNRLPPVRVRPAAK